jgi:hypothetical protein
VNGPESKKNRILSFELDFKTWKCIVAMVEQQVKKYVLQPAGCVETIDLEGTHV